MLNIESASRQLRSTSHCSNTGAAHPSSLARPGASTSAPARGSAHCSAHWPHSATPPHRTAPPSRRALLLAGVPAALLAPLPWQPLGCGAPPVQAAGVKCPGLTGYALRQCFKELRAQQAASGEGTEGGEPEQERLRQRQYEQPGELVTLPSGVQYREMDAGGSSGPAAEPGATCEVSYIVYRLSSGAYFKYSSGGTPVLLFALGYGTEGQDDLGAVYRFRLGEPGSLPAAATAAMVGMRAGGRRRILVPPQLGWTSGKVGPIPATFGGQRRLASHSDEPLLLEVQLQRVYAPAAAASGSELQAVAPGAEEAGPLLRGQPFRLPAPPTPFTSRLPGS